MERKLEGKVAIVTGGSRGLGWAIAERLAADGALVRGGTTRYRPRLGVRGDLTVSTTPLDLPDSP